MASTHLFPRCVGRLNRSFSGLRGASNLLSFERFLLLILLLTPVVTCLPNDRNATLETVQLYKHLQVMASNPDAIMFGQSSATWNGVYGGHAPYQITYNNETTRAWRFTEKQANTAYPDELCDVRSVTGHYPAVIDFGMANLEEDRTVVLSYLLKRFHKRGGISTLTQHLNNPVTGGSPWVANDTGDVLHTVRRLLPGGDFNWKYRKNLDGIASLVQNLKDDQGKLIPVLYRPLHELNGDWFWWGLGNKANNTEQDLISFYRYIMTYLRDTRQVHNLLYVFAPDKFKDKTDYLKVYPGDDFVDIMATDFYYKSDNDTTADFRRSVTDLVEMAQSKNKIATIAECGLFDNEIDLQVNFWNKKVLDELKASQTTRQIAYVLTWANGCDIDHCGIWAPFKGHPAANDFYYNFFKDPVTVFGSTD